MKAHSLLGYMLAALALGAAGCVMAGGADEASLDDVDRTEQAVSSGAHSIVSNLTNKCWDIPNGIYNTDTPVNQYTCHGGSNQRFQLTNAFNSVYSISIGGKCVQPQWLRPPYGTDNIRLVLKPCLSGTNATLQQFDFFGGSQIRWAYDSSYCVDIPSGVNWDGVYLQMYRCHGGPNQSWREP